MSKGLFLPSTFDGTKKAGDALDKMRLADGSPKFIVQIVPHTANALRGWDAAGNPAAWTLDDVTNYAAGKIPAGPQGRRGSMFLGNYATASNLPAIDGVSVMIGDFAYILDAGELWRAN